MRYVALITGEQGRVVREGAVNVVLVPLDMLARVEATLQIVHPSAKTRAAVPRDVSQKKKLDVTFVAR